MGFYGDSKRDIYKLLPKDIYPKTEHIIINSATNYQELIAKPICISFIARYWL